MTITVVCDQNSQNFLYLFSLSNERTYPYLNFICLFFSNYRKSLIICSQPHIALPAKGRESGDWYLYYADLLVSMRKSFFFLTTGIPLEVERKYKIYKVIKHFGLRFYVPKKTPRNLPQEALKNFTLKLFQKNYGQYYI